MPDRHIRRPALALVAAVTLLVGLVPTVTAAAPTGRPTNLTATPLTPSGRVTGFKSASADLAKSDPKLVARTDSTMVNVMIKLDYDATASYAGDLKAYAATSPRITGKPLTGKSAVETRVHQPHQGRGIRLHQGAQGEDPECPDRSVVPGGVWRDLRRIPAKNVKDVLEDRRRGRGPGRRRRTPTDRLQPGFHQGQPAVPGARRDRECGRGVIYGNLDTGIWPEHPSFADLGNLGAPPPKADGTARVCDFGDNPLTPAVDPFACQHKLISGQAFLATYDAVNDPEVYGDTARDSDGHGTHTSSTSAGNIVQHAIVLGTDRGQIHGIAPGAWVAEYKVCGAQAAATSVDTVGRASQQAIKDGVDVINYSIGGGTDPFTDSTELAFLDAYAAGVFVSASAGNSGPGAGTAEHLSPWVTSVGASTQTREFASTLTVNGAHAASS